MKKKFDFKYNKKKDGWKLIRSADFNQNPPTFKEFLKNNEDCVDGKELMARAKKLGAPAGQLHTEHILLNGSIPSELEKFALLFLGTIWEHPDGYKCIPALRIGQICEIEELAGFGIPVIDGFHNCGWIIDFVRLDKKLLNPARIAISQSS